MDRKTALQVVIAVTGVLFVAGVWPMVVFVREEPALSMMMSVYVVLGIFLLLSVRRPAEHRTLIAFAGWSSIAHSVWMSAQAVMGMVMKRELIGSGVFFVLGLLLVALRPSRVSVTGD